MAQPSNTGCKQKKEKQMIENFLPQRAQRDAEKISIICNEKDFYRKVRKECKGRKENKE